MNKILGLFVLMLVPTICCAQEDIYITYHFNRDTSNPNSINVTAKIINNSDKDIYFLSESCNGLDYYITTTSDSVKFPINIHCNATFPIKNELKANATFEFKTTIQLNATIEEVGLQLRFVQLKASTVVEGKFVNAIIQANHERTLMLKGPIVKIK